MTSRTSRLGPAKGWARDSAMPLLVAFIALTIVMFSLLPRNAGAAAAPLDQCNNDTASNVGGQGIACTVTIDNYLSVSGSVEVTAPSTVTVTKCTGAAGPIGAGSGTCTTTTTTSAEPISLIQQCNGSGNGGGGVVICTVNLINHFSGSIGPSTASARIYQCVGSEISGPGAPGSCTPANTAGVTSVSDATVGQCNGSGNGGTSVGFTCTVTAGSTMTADFPVQVDQCNGSGNGGGSLVICSAGVSNQVVTPPATPTATPTAGSSTPNAGTETPTITPGTATPPLTPGAGTATPPITATATRTPSPTVSTPTSTIPIPSTTNVPLPPATGNTVARGGNSGPTVLVMAVALSLALTAAWIATARRRAQ